MSIVVKVQDVSQGKTGKKGRKRKKKHTHKANQKTNLNANHAGTGKLFVMIVHNSYRSISVVYG